MFISTLFVLYYTYIYTFLVKFTNFLFKISGFCLRELANETFEYILGVCISDRVLPFKINSNVK